LAVRSEIRGDFKNLNRFVKAVSSKGSVKVGILGKKTHRKEGELTNAEIGATHEFGSFSKGVPMRSFLRMPLHQKQKVIVKEAADGLIKRLVKGKDKEALERMGASCVRAIMLAFASRGFGQWVPNSPETIRRKGSASPLIDTAQLRRSITAVVDNA
jgi:hypothetical protein